MDELTNVLRDIDPSVYITLYTTTRCKMYCISFYHMVATNQVNTPGINVYSFYHIDALINLDFEIISITCDVYIYDEVKKIIEIYLDKIRSKKRSIARTALLKEELRDAVLEKLELIRKAESNDSKLTNVFS